jgi:hypothetical protein
MIESPEQSVLTRSSRLEVKVFHGTPKPAGVLTPELYTLQVVDWAATVDIEVANSSTANITQKGKTVSFGRIDSVYLRELSE